MTNAHKYTYAWWNWLCISVHTSAACKKNRALNVTREQSLRLVRDEWLRSQKFVLHLCFLSLWCDCQSKSLPPHGNGVLNSGVLVLSSATHRGEAVEWVELRVLPPGPEAQAAVYDMKEPYVRSAQFRRDAFWTHTHTQRHTRTHTQLSKSYTSLYVSGC